MRRDGQKKKGEDPSPTSTGGKRPDADPYQSQPSALVLPERKGKKRSGKGFVLRKGDDVFQLFDIRERELLTEGGVTKKRRDGVKEGGKKELLLFIR